MDRLLELAKQHEATRAEDAPSLRLAAAELALSVLEKRVTGDALDPFARRVLEIVQGHIDNNSHIDHTNDTRDG